MARSERSERAVARCLVARSERSERAVARCLVARSERGSCLVVGLVVRYAAHVVLFGGTLQMVLLVVR